MWEWARQSSFDDQKLTNGLQGFVAQASRASIILIENPYYLQYHHNEDLILLPASSWTFLQRQGISLILLRISSIVIRSHSCCIAALNSAIVLHFPLCYRCFIISQIASIGLRSGDWAGWTSISRSASCLRQKQGLSVDLLLWEGSPFSWRKTDA